MSAHLDPDLDQYTARRGKNWRAAFGQVGSSESHLRKQGVTVGDLFLFFGWFREAQRVQGELRYRNEASDGHFLFGWLQVGAVLNCADPVAQGFIWAANHPHFSGGYGTAYVATKDLTFGGRATGFSGAGVFRNSSPVLQLTSPNQPNRSVWRMPPWFRPRDGNFPMTYHCEVSRYTCKKEEVQVRTVARGQEFVIDVTEYPEAIRWAREIISAGSSKQ
jgi:hypothetical protein